MVIAPGANQLITKQYVQNGVVRMPIVLSNTDNEHFVECLKKNFQRP